MGNWLNEPCPPVVDLGQSVDLSAVTRFEVIDHTTPDCGVSRPRDGARAVVAYGISVALSLQDDGRTLKVFLADRR